MAYTQADADALRRAIASGEHTVTYDGKTVTFRSIKELERALARVESALSAATGGPTRQLRVATRKGL